MSREALSQMQQGAATGLIAEHAVPVSVVNERVLELAEPTLDTIADLVLELTVLSVITEEEHDRLAAAGLRKTMPQAWDGLNAFSRYEAVGIEVEPNQFVALTGSR